MRNVKFSPKRRNGAIFLNRLYRSRSGAPEDELKVKLYRRDGRKFALTQAGEYFYKRAKKILREVENLKEDTLRIGTDDESDLSIGSLSGYDGSELSRAVAEFSKI